MKIIKKKIFWILILMSSTALAQAQKLTLEESIKIGLENSGEIKIAKSKVIGADAKVSEVFSQMLPKLTLGGGYTNVNLTKPDAIGLIPGNPVSIKNPFYSYGLNLTIQQPLFTGFQLSSLKSAAEYNKESIESDLQKTLNQKAFEIYNAYWNYYKAVKSSYLLEENLKTLKQKLSDTEKFKENGLATENDVLKLQVQVANSEMNLIDAKNKLEIARAYFNKTLGLPLNDSTEIDTTIHNKLNFQLDYEELFPKALSNRWELKSLSKKIEAGKEYVTASNSGWWPQLYAVGSYYFYNVNAETFNVNKQDLRLWYFGLSLNWNLWDWGNTSAKATQSEQELLQANEQFKLLKEQIKLEVYSNYKNLQSAKEKIDVALLAIKSAEENYRVTEEKYNNQLATTTDLINAQTDLLNAKTNYAIALADYQLAIVKLKLAVGEKIY